MLTVDHKGIAFDLSKLVTLGFIRDRLRDTGNNFNMPE